MSLRRIKADDATGLHMVELGPIGPSIFQSNTGPQRVSMDELVKRFGLLVHRCVTLNADTAAGICPRLFVIGNSSAVTKAHSLGPRKLDHETKAFLLGKRTLKPSESVKACLQGNIDNLTEVTKHPVLDLIRNVNPWWDGFALRHERYASLGIFGRAFELTVNGPDGLPAELWPMMAQYTTPIKDPAEFVSGFQYKRGVERKRYEPDEINWYRLGDPTDHWGGFGPLEAWLKTIDATISLVEFQDWLWTRGGAPDYVLHAPHGMNEAQERGFLADWKRRFGRLRNRLYNVMVLKGKETSLMPLGHKPRELELSKLHEQNRDSVTWAFGVPKAMVTSDDVNLANAREGSIVYMRHTIWPMIQRIEDADNQRFLPKWSDRLIFIHDNPIMEDRVIRIQERASFLRSGASVDELRIQDGMETLGTPESEMAMIDRALQPLAVFAVPEAVATDGDQVILPEDGLQTTQATVLNGAQINAASLIVQSVADGLLPLDAARGQLTIMFNLTSGQANAMLGSAATFEQRTPPAAAPDPTGPPPNSGRDDDKSAAAVSQKALFFDADSCCELHKQDVGPIADDSFDGYLNPPYAKDVLKVQQAQAQRVIDKLKSGKAVRKAETATQVVNRVMPTGEFEDWMEEMVEVSAARISQTVATTGVAAITELDVSITFDLQNKRAQRYIERASRRIGRQATDTWRSELRSAILAGVEAGESSREIAKRIQAIKGAEFTKSKANQIARTETAFASTAGTLEGWQQSGVVEAKQFLLAPGACPWCQAVAARYGDGMDAAKNKPIDLDKPFYEKGDTIEGVFETEKGSSVRVLKLDYSSMQGAPVHPNCRCTVRPIIIEESE